MEASSRFRRAESKILPQLTNAVAHRGVSVFQIVNHGSSLPWVWVTANFIEGIVKHPRVCVCSLYFFSVVLCLTFMCFATFGCGSATSSGTTSAPVAPTFAPGAGTYTSQQAVMITDATAGARIYYTTDGSTPSTSSNLVSGPIAVSSTEILQAVASLNGQLSPVLTAAYVINLPPVAPAFAPGAGTYTSVQSVTITDATAGAKIYYTTDGSTPSPSSNLVSGPIAVSSTETIQAVASLNGQLSPVFTAAYVINLPPTSLWASSGSGQAAQVGNGLAAPLEVSVLNSNTAPVSGITVSFSAPASGPSVIFSSSSCTTDSTGKCSITARANASVGTFTVTASTAALGTAFTLTNTGLHSYVVTVSSDATAGVASNCLDQSTNSGPANSNCSLRDAMAAAAATASSSQSTSITFAQTSPTTIHLANGPLALPSYTAIQGATSGSGANLTNLITVDGNNLIELFTQAAGIVQTTIDNLILAHGYSSQVGGAIYSFGSLNVNNSTFFANQAALSGGAISNNGGALSVFGSTFQNNISQSVAGYGGGIDNFGNGTVSVSNSTFTGNQAYDGGAFYSSGPASITDSTIVGNTASFGGGIYNKSTTFTVSNSIVNGNTNEDCGGVYCAPLWAYVLFTATTPSPIDSNAITIAFTDSLGNSFSQTVTYGPFSSPAGLGATFGPYFAENFSGLDTASISGQPIGNLFILTPANGATLSPLHITDPGQSFLATQVTYPNPLSLNNNVYGLSAEINLSPLQNNGGPTQTMLPLSGSKALCAITPSNSMGSDQRGQPRTATVASSTCQDAGAVQTAN